MCHTNCQTPTSSSPGPIPSANSELDSREALLARSQPLLAVGLAHKHWPHYPSGLFLIGTSRLWQAFWVLFTAQRTRGSTPILKDTRYLSCPALGRAVKRCRYTRCLGKLLRQASLPKGMGEVMRLIQEPVHRDSAPYTEKRKALLKCALGPKNKTIKRGVAPCGSNDYTA